MIDVLCLFLNYFHRSLLDGVGLITAFAIPAAVCYFLAALHSSFSDS
jgi:hypothetical protein